MTQLLINKSMDRDDLSTSWAQPHIDALNKMITDLYNAGTPMTSWYGTLPGDDRELIVKSEINQEGSISIGIANRGTDYQALPNATDDTRIPWYLYWEIVWVMTHGPSLSPSSRILDAGGTASLFSCYLASLGHEIHSIDLNNKLIAQGAAIAKAMNWNLHSYAMNMQSIDFPSEYFDHAYSICVFEHLTFELKQKALTEIARVLKPGGILSITFDYRNPAPFVVGIGHDDSPENRLASTEDLHRSFLSTGLFELVGNQDFFDNGKSYLVHPSRNNKPYTFGAIFLKKLG